MAKSTLNKKLLVLCFGLVVAMSLESIVSVISLTSLQTKRDKDLLRIQTMVNQLAEMENQIKTLRTEKQNITTAPEDVVDTNVFLEGPKRMCPDVPLQLHGRVHIHETVLPMEEIEKLNPDVVPGGSWTPSSCTRRFRIAILIPYRDRYEHLRALLRHIHPFLQKQLNSYTIFTIEQTNFTAFNRGFLINVGFTEANRLGQFDCFIIHDVDLLPEDDRNVYTCPEYPRLMAVTRSNLNYTFAYRAYFGGVSVISRYHFLKVNGYSNRFFGWGGEDDDFYTRLHDKGIIVDRLSSTIGRYHSEYHEKAVPNPKRDSILSQNRKQFFKEGLATTRYRILKRKRFKLYTWILTQPL